MQETGGSLFVILACFELFKHDKSKRENDLINWITFARFSKTEAIPLFTGYETLENLLNLFWLQFP